MAVIGYKQLSTEITSTITRTETVGDLIEIGKFLTE